MKRKNFLLAGFALWVILLFHITTLNAQDWYPLGQGIDGSILTTVISGNDLYVGGSFLDAGGIADADYLARWDGCEWHAVAPGLNGPVFDIEVFGQNVFVGGAFTSPINHIGYWNGVQWISPGPGLNANVNAIEINGMNIYAGGEFTDAGGNTNADYVALWNGSSWVNLGIPLNNSVNDLEWNGQDLYIIGNFTNAGNNDEADYVARWNGSMWFNVGTVIKGFPPITNFGQLELHNQDVWIGGNFSIEGVNQLVCLAQWNGTTWTGFFNSTVRALHIFENMLYFASGATDCGYLGTLNMETNTWGMLQGCLETSVFSFAANGTDVFAGGYFVSGPEYACPSCNIMRYGPTTQTLIITGMPSEICETDPPIDLPTQQSSFIGNWSGPGVVDNIFDPSGLEGDITLTYTPDEAGCLSPVDVVISITTCFSTPSIDWIWAKAISGDDVRPVGGAPTASAVATDTSGASYTVGYFVGTVDFNPEGSEYFLTAIGTDGFICKLNADGNFQWAKQIGGDGAGVFLNSVTTDLAGNVFITGGFSTGVDFDPGPLTHYLSAWGNADAFILKLNQYGQFQWVKPIRGVEASGWGSSIKIETSTGNIYSTGSFSGEIDFDPGDGGYFLGNIDQEPNVYILKLSSAGDFIWAKEIEGPSLYSYMAGTSIAIDQTIGDVYIGGHFDGTCDLNPGDDTILVTSNGFADIFIIKLTSTGNYIWYRQIGGPGIDYSPSIALGKGPNEKLFVSGAFSQTVDFDPGPGVFNLTAQPNLFVTKLDTAGHFVWAKSFGSANGIPYFTWSGSFLCVDTLRKDNVYTAGGFGGTTDFDPGPDIHPATSLGYVDVFVCKIDSSGNFGWVKVAGGSSDDAGVSLALKKNGKVVTAGNYDSPTLLFDQTELTNTDYQNVFIAEAGGCSTVVTNTNNDGPGSLRDVIHCAQDADLITFSLPPVSEITLTTGEIPILKDLSLIGPGINNLTISGNNHSRIFHLGSGYNFTIKNMSLKNASALLNGGAIFSKGQLTLQQMLLENNLQNGSHKALTLHAPSTLTILGSVVFKY